MSDTDSATTPSSSSSSVKMVSVYEEHFARVKKANAALEAKYHVSAVEISVALIYPLIVVLGQIVWWLESMIGSETHLVGNYFTSKRNLANILFVKQGWGWTSVIFGWILLKRAMILQKNRHLEPKAVAKSVVRFVVATLWWVFFTQWLFGDSLMDRVFIATGGKCHEIAHTSKLEKFLERNPGLKSKLRAIEIETGSFLGPGIAVPSNFVADANEKLVKYEAIVSSTFCRALGGSWEGGHDPSGHCFLLVHSSLFILFEMMPLISLFLKDLHQNNQLFANFVDRSELLSLIVANSAYKSTEDFEKFTALRKNSSSEQSRAQSVLALIFNPLVVTSLLIILWGWMLFITCVYFHSLPELLAGTLAGYFEVVPVYWGTRWLS